MATPSSSLTWEIPWTEESGGLPSTGFQRVGHDLATKNNRVYLSYRVKAVVLEVLGCTPPEPTMSLKIKMSQGSVL